MKKIFIEQIDVSNFGGVAKATYTFGKDTNVLAGRSGSGKSSAYNAYLWALGFNVPTWEPLLEGYRLLKVKTEARVTLNVDGVKYVICKTNEPKYKINKFTYEEEYVGTDFKYFIDEQELTAGAYKDKITELYGVDYFTLELLSNTSLFNNEDGKRWDKNERRKYLFKLFDLDNKIAELSSNPEFEPIKEYLLKNNDEMEINQILNTMKTNIENEMKSNQVIMEEKQNELAEYNAIDFSVLEGRKTELSSILDKLTSESKENSVNTLFEEKQKEISSVQLEINKLMSEKSAVEQDFKRRQFDCESKLKSTQQDIQFCNNKIKRLENEIQDAEIELEDIGNEKFDENSTICPTCKQTLPDDKIQELRNNFESNKETRIEKCRNSLENARSERENVLDRINTLQEQESALNAQLEAIRGEEQKDYDCDIQKLVEQKDKLVAELSTVETSDNTKEVAEKISALKVEYENVVRELAKKDNIEKINARIEELKTRARELGVQDAERISKKQALKKYKDAKVELINESINNNFDTVRYLFRHYLGAGAAKEYEDICTCTLNNVAYEGLSSGQKVKADMFTNNSLRKILNVDIPQFIDDCVLSDFEFSDKAWQVVYLVTDNSTAPNLTLVRDVYSVDDCDVKKKD